MKNILRTALLFSSLNLFFSCSESQNANPSAAVTPPSAELKTINGTVRAISFGKDGYTAEVQTDADGLFAALVSIANVGGKENYKSCAVGDKVTFKGTPSVLDGANLLMVKEIINISTTQTQMLIGQNSFRGIQLGDMISKHSEYIQKTKLKTGEGTFDAYEIKDFDNNPAGYILPDPKNKDLVGDITVTSPKAQTAEGIKIGSTFQELQKVFPGIEVHGSEIEGRTHARVGNLSYRLDVANFSYEIDKSKIPGATKITEIIIYRSK
jgi:hypothetical protein